MTINANPSGIGENTISGKRVVNRIYYTVSGIAINKPVQDGITIEKPTYDDGTTEVRKSISGNRAVE